MLSRQASNTHPVPTGIGAAQGDARRKLFLHIVRCAVNQRRHLMRAGKSRPVDLSRLQLWLERNPYPSDATMRAFPLLAALGDAMPHHEAGKKMLAQARRIVNGLPLDHL